MHWSKAEFASWGIAILVIIGMGVLVFFGPFHNINKGAAKTVLSPISVKIVTATGKQAEAIGLYEPKTVTARVGQQVIFTNISNAPHTVTENKNAFNSGNVGTGGATWVFTGTKTGSFPYYCQYHPLMHGAIVVR